MGFPATGCETLYRNSLADLKLYLDRFHGEYKIYNLCIEKKRIYPKEIWTDKKVGLFPFNDHAPCPIKLILDFCIDICLYLTINPKSVACIHCKAGKGRTGVMIVCYLLFSGLCQTADEALTHYASQRTLNGKGVTIPSQIRYIKYFETFLSANYERPFVRRIPKIIKVDLDRGYTNIITNYNTDMAYFTTINSFKLKKCLIGPFSEELDLQYDFSAITIKKLNFEKSKLTRKIINQGYYYEIEMCSDDIINYDLKLSIKSKKVKFYSWFNLWFNTFEIISKYVIKNNYFERERQTESNINRAMSQLEIEEAKKKRESDDMNGVEKKKLSKALGEIISNYDEARGKRKISAIKSMKNNKDLNNILNGIDRLARDLKIPVLDRENLEFTIERKQLDKLKTKLKDPFKVKYTYELLK
jgi:phosphatidylinositol-3,4,5-trisphosphate 3-phosphatase/dual-specificity protein phosphatase PTEN